MIPLAALEDVIDASGVAPRIEALLPSGARARQLAVRTLLLGMMLALADGRPAHLTRVHRALTGLPEGEQRRLGVLADWKNGPHLLTYRQAEYTFGLVAGALGKDEPDGLPSPELQRTCDDLLEAIRPGGVQGRQLVAGRGLERPGVLLPAPAARHQRLRRPRGLVGAPQEQPARTTRTSCSSATTCRTRSRCRTSTGRPSPSSPAA